EVFSSDAIPGSRYGSFSADGRYAAIAGQGGIYLFRMPDEVETPSRTVSSRPEEKMGLVRRLAWENREQGVWARFSRDGRDGAASGGRWPLAAGKTQAYQVWEVSTRMPVQKITGFPGAACMCLLTADGKQLVASNTEPGGQPQLVHWDVATGQKLGALPVPSV